MAITLLSEPVKVLGNTTVIYPVYNQIAYKVTSDNNTECNMKYICDVYIDGVFKVRLKLFPDINGDAEFKINRVLEDYVSSYPEINLLIQTDNQSSIINYQVKFGEEYDTSASCDGSSVTVYDNLLVLDEAYVWSAALQYKEFFEYQYITPTKYILDSLTPGKFLTNQPDTILIGENDQATLSFLNLPYVYYYGNTMKIETYDKYGTNLETKTVGLSPTGSFSNTFQTIGVGPFNINQYFGTSVINSNVDNYKVSLWSPASTGALNKNVACEYLGGNNFWTTDSYPGCSSSFGITNADQMVLTIPDVTCSNTFRIEYTDRTFTPGKQYQCSINVLSVNNPSGADQYFQFDLGGTLGTQVVGAGYTDDTIICGPSGTFAINAFFDADTAGFGAHGAIIISVQIIEFGSNRTSEYKTFEIDRRCSRYNPIRFFWLNTYGGYDSYSFNMSNTKTTNITKSEYNQLLSTGYDIGDRGRTNLAVKANDKITATSNWMSEEESLWLEGLYTSQDVYIYDETLLKFVPVIITSNSFEEKVKARTRNINHTIEFEYAYDKNIQRQ